MVNVLIKNVDERAYKKAKMLAVREERKVGEVVSEAIFLLAREHEKPGLGVAKPVSLGKGSELFSKEIDEFLYE